ncbi:hypothetical protein [Actinomadura sp. WMMA1423]|uniref:hypothetical protein n=1 Tax=Actinomadura sp. WMMA1423 TaxID=2591108 RepID=UPI001146F238|nr:hypothetical protein [Actinomadura sp. WMMA1423]
MESDAPEGDSEESEETATQESAVPPEEAAPRTERPARPLADAFQGAGFKIRPIGFRFPVPKYPLVDTSLILRTHNELLIDFGKITESWLQDFRLRIPLDLGIPDDWEPPNWGDRCFYENGIFNLDLFDAAETIMKEEGLPLAYVPHSELVNALLLAENKDARRALLVSHRGDVIEDCTETLKEITHPDLQGHRAAIQDALAALAQGIDGPAQSHAANVFDQLLRHIMRNGVLFPESLGEFFYHDKTAKRLKRRWVHDDIDIAEFRAGCVLTPAVPALRKYTSGRDPIPDTFNRHATSHAVHSAVQFTEANAIIGCMLATSLLREIHDSGW